MAKVNEMLSGKYLGKDDIGAGALLTIASVSRKNVAREDDEPEHKWVMSFKETDKGLVLNSTNIQLTQQALGSDDTDHWIGRQIVLYTDPTISYAGKVVGGIRVRAPKGRAAQPVPVAPPTPVRGFTTPAQMAPTAAEVFGGGRVPGEDDDDVPF